ncbi:MAG: hypothetical protein JSS81_23255 [Acidobacteria bacterium]|nr:hypothetical protein [Acidobacteriota bacterium]
MKYILLFIILAVALPIFGQKATALKFDEFADYPAELVSPLYDRAKRFDERLRREPAASRGVVVYYNARKGKYPLEGGKEWAKSALSWISSSWDEPKRQIETVDGGYREYRTLEFWIVPAGAEMPRPTPSFKSSDLVYCPEINVAGDGFGRTRTESLNFSVVVKGAPENLKYSLEWSVSAGRIVDGQGTNRIAVDLSNTDAEKVTASVIVKGLSPECGPHAFATTGIGLFPRIIDEFPMVPYSEIAARMDAVFLMLNSDPTARSNIIIYGSRNGLKSKKEFFFVSNNLRKYIAFRRYDPGRVTIVDGGFRERMWVEVYLVPTGVEPPRPTPTLNGDFVEEPAKKIVGKRKKQ